ncbi:MAG: NADH-quinone oxidoreductase subunit N [Gemmatimonadota bacterium]
MNEPLDLVAPSLGGVAPLILVSLAAMLALVTDLFARGTSHEDEAGDEPLLAFWISLLGVGAALLLVCFQAGTLDRFGGRSFSGMFTVDGFGLFFTAIFLIGTLLVMLLTVDYARRERLHVGEYYFLLLMSTAGGILMAQSTNLIMIFLGLELLSIAVYVLAGFDRTRARSIEAALKYFLLGAFSSGFFLYGIALLYGATGSMDLAVVAARAPEPGEGLLFPAGIVLLLVGFAFKVAIVPFHMWSPDVYEGSPTPVTAYMAATVKAAGFAAFVRVFLTTFESHAASWVPLLAVLAVATMVVGNLAALAQSNLKRLLAYSSIAHAGYLLVALVARNELGASSFLFYLLAYTLMTLGAFGVVIALGRRGEANEEMSDLAGLGSRHPFLAAAMSVFMFSLAGIPPTAGFIGKFYIFSAALDAGLGWLAVVMVLASVVSVYYYLKVTVAMYMWEGGATASLRPAPLLVTALVIALLGVLQLGIFPGPVIDLAGRSVQGVIGVAQTAGP